MFWVVCYDVVDDKRRRRVQKILEGAGRRVQYSVFECELEPNHLVKLEKQLKRAIRNDEDDVRFYPLNEGDIKKVILLGRAQLQRGRSHYVI